MTTSSRPTESAIIQFRFAARTAGAAGRKSVVTPHKAGEFNTEMSIAINELASGLADMLLGLCATYLLLEKLDQDIRALKSQAR